MLVSLSDSYSDDDSISVRDSRSSSSPAYMTTDYLRLLTTALKKCMQCWSKKTVLVRRGSHWGRSLQDGLRDEQTCGTTLASAYVLCHLSATWLQLQMMGRSPRWE